MGKEKIENFEFSELRRQAEGQIRTQPGRSMSLNTEDDPRRLLHELQVYQVELEMQNEELRQALAEQEKMELLVGTYSDLYDFAPVGYLTLGRNNDIIAVNLTAAGFLGIARSRLIGRRFDRFVAPDSKLAFTSFHEKLFAPPGRKICELSLLTNRKTSFFVQVEGEKTGSGDERRIVLTDITEQKQIEKALAESELSYRTVGETIQFGTWKADVEGAWMYASDSFLNMLGMTLPELQLSGWLNHLPPEERVPTQEHWLHCLETGEDFQREHQFSGKDGKTYFVLAIGRQVRDVRGKILGWAGINLDMTKRKEREDEIERLNTELEDTNRDLDAFNSTVAHDLRQPLTVIHGYSQVIQQLGGHCLDEQCTGFLKEIYDGTLRMDQIISALLKFSRQVHLEPHRKPIDLSAMAHEAAETLQLSEPERRAMFRISDGMVVDGDKTLLRVVLDNLFGNAWKYTGLQKAAVVDFGMTEIDGVQVCFVRDNGVGFDMKDAGKLYLPFQRLPGAEKFKGFGLGLATVERIIHHHGGKTWAEGEPGQGATFYFTLGQIAGIPATC